jgi:hypothetical protein
MVEDDKDPISFDEKISNKVNRDVLKEQSIV